MVRKPSERLTAIFHEAAERNGDEREAFLREACGADAELRAELDELLALGAEGDDLFERSRDGFPRALESRPSRGCWCAPARPTASDGPTGRASSRSVARSPRARTYRPRSIRLVSRAYASTNATLACGGAADHLLERSVSTCKTLGTSALDAIESFHVAHFDQPRGRFSSVKFSTRPPNKSSTMKSFPSAGDSEGEQTGSSRVLRRTSGIFRSGFLLLLLMRPAIGQTQIHVLHGLTPNDKLGEPVAGAGDVNLDGFEDVMVYAKDDLTGSDGGSVRVFSGADGSLLHAWHGDTSYSQAFGRSLARAGDVDGDGHPDVVIGAQDSPSSRAYVFSGRDGSLLYVFDGDAPGDSFYYVAGAGDVNGDGHADLLVGGPGSDLAGPNHGIARIYSGRDGAVLRTFFGTSPNSGFGVAVAGLGDLDADGRSEVAVGAPYANTPNGSGSGRIAVYSGIDGSVLYTFDGPSAGAHLGAVVASAGDVDADGVPDLAAAAPTDGTIFPMAGMVRVYSGAGGGVVREWFGTAADERFGWWVRGMGDLDGDGYADVGALSIVPEILHIFSGRTAQTLYVLGPDTLGGPVYAMDGAGDVNGDGGGDFVLSPGPGPWGLTYVYSGSEHIVSYCYGDGSGTACPCFNPGAAGAGCANSTGAGAVLEATGSASLADDDLVFAATHLPPNKPALLFCGSGVVNGGAGLPFGDGLRCASGQVQRLGLRWVDVSGSAAWGPGLARIGGWSPGDLRRFQVWYRDPLGPCGGTFNLTNGSELGFSH